MRIDDCAPAGVDEDGTFPHALQRCRVDQVPGTRIQRAVERHDVRLLEQIVQRNILDRTAIVRTRVRIGP